MTVKVFLTVSYLWLTFTTLANGQYFQGQQNFSPGRNSPGNPFIPPNGQHNFSPGGNWPGNQFIQPNGQHNFSPGGNFPGNPFTQPNGQPNFSPGGNFPRNPFTQPNGQLNSSPGGNVPGNPFTQPNGQQNSHPGGNVPGNPFTQPNNQHNFFPGRKVPGNPFSQPNRQPNFLSPGGQVPSFSPTPQVANPQNMPNSNSPNSNSFLPQDSNTPQIMDISALLHSLLANQPTTLESQNPASSNPAFSPETSSPSVSYPEKTSPFSIGPQDPNPVLPELQPRDSFRVRPHKPRNFIPHRNPQIINPSSLGYQSPNPSFNTPQKPSLSYSSPQENIPSVPQQTNLDSPSPQQIPQDPRDSQQADLDYSSPQQINTDSTGPQQSNSGPPTVFQPINPDSTGPQQIPQYPIRPQQANEDSTGPQQSSSGPPTVSQPISPNSSTTQQIPQDPTDPQQINSASPTVPQSTDSGSTVPQQTDSSLTVPQAINSGSTVPQTINSGSTVPQTADTGSTVPQTTDSGSSIPQTTDSGSTVSQKTESYSTDPQTINPATDGGQPIASASETSSSVSKSPQNTGSMPTAPQHPYRGRGYNAGHRSQPRKEMNRQPVGDPLKGLKIVCIFNNKHFYKNGFTPAQLEPHLCTHLNYEFAILDPKTYEMMTGEPYLDDELNFYQEAVDLKKVNPKLKVMMSLGGWGDSTKKYSEMADDPSKRDNFVKKAIPFLLGHGFDGMDLAWEYPNCWQGALGVSPKDKPNFVALLKELKQEFEKNNLLLSVSVGAIKREVDAAYDVPEIEKIVDYMNVMTYDMHGPWEPVTTHHVQFEAMPGDKDKYCNVKGGMQVWVEKGASKKKLNMGLAFYGRTFRMKDPNHCGMGVPAIGAGAAGPITKEGGILSYHEICNFLNNGNWTEKEDPHAGFYACSEDQFACYDPPMMMVRKAKYVVESGFGGVLLKDMSGDDSKGECFNMPFPQLKMVRLEMIHKLHQMKYS